MAAMDPVSARRDVAGSALTTAAVTSAMARGAVSCPALIQAPKSTEPRAASLCPARCMSDETASSGTARILLTPDERLDLFAAQLVEAETSSRPFLDEVRL